MAKTVSQSRLSKFRRGTGVSAGLNYLASRIFDDCVQVRALWIRLAR